MNRPVLWLVALVSLMMVGCPAEMNVTDAGGLADVGLDVPVLPDTPSDDVDMDGVVTSMDCDDADAAVGLTGVRSCTSVCGEGVETCIAGTWGTCSVGTECLCAIVGETRMAACDRCGRAVETCGADNRWARGACMDQGECNPGEEVVSPSTCCECMDQLMICGDSCMFEEIVQRFPGAECAIRGTCRCTGSGGEFCSICDTRCMLMPVDACP